MHILMRHDPSRTAHLRLYRRPWSTRVVLLACTSIRAQTPGPDQKIEDRRRTVPWRETGRCRGRPLGVVPACGYPAGGAGRRPRR